MDFHLIFTIFLLVAIVKLRFRFGLGMCKLIEKNIPRNEKNQECHEMRETRIDDFVEDVTKKIQNN